MFSLFPSIFAWNSPQLISQIDTQSQVDHVRIAGFSSVTLPLIDGRVLKYLSSLRDLLGLDTTKEEKSDDSHQLVTLIDNVQVTCLGVALRALALPSIRLAITSVEAATTAEMIEHVRKCAIRTLPTLMLDIFKAWL